MNFLQNIFSCESSGKKEAVDCKPSTEPGTPSYYSKKYVKDYGMKFTTSNSSCCRGMDEHCYMPQKKDCDEFRSWEECFTDEDYIIASLKAYQTSSEAQTNESVFYPYKKQEILLNDTSSDMKYALIQPAYQKSTCSEAETNSYYSTFDFINNDSENLNGTNIEANDHKSNISGTNRGISYRNTKVIYLTTNGGKANEEQPSGSDKKSQPRNAESSHCNSKSGSAYQMNKFIESWIPYVKQSEDQQAEKKKDTCDCVKCESKKCPFKRNDQDCGCKTKGRDELLDKLKKAYQACSCDVCECIPVKGRSLALLSNATQESEVPPPKKKKKKKFRILGSNKDKCKCAPCDCFDCPAAIEEPKKKKKVSTSEALSTPPAPSLAQKVEKPPPPAPLTESQMRLQFYSNLGQGKDVSALCDCDPCECVACNKERPPIEEPPVEEEEDEYEAEMTQTVLTTGGRFNYKCHCEICECMYCKALAQPCCKCDPCDCYMCQGLRVEEDPLTCDVICHSCKLPDKTETRTKARMLCKCNFCSCTECNKGDKCPCDSCKCTECTNDRNRGDVKEYCKCEPCECAVCKGAEKICSCKHCDCFECLGVKIRNIEDEVKIKGEMETTVTELDSEPEIVSEPSFEYLDPPPCTDMANPMCRCTKCECENCKSSAGGDICQCLPCECVICKSRPIKVMKPPKPKPPLICKASFTCPKSEEDMEYFAFMKNLCNQKDYPIYKPEAFKYDLLCCKCENCECVECVNKRADGKLSSVKSVRIQIPQEVEEEAVIEESPKEDVFEQFCTTEHLVRIEEPVPICNCTCHPCDCILCKFDSADRLYKNKEMQCEPPTPPPSPPPVVIKVLHPKCCCDPCECEKCTALEDIILVQKNKCKCDICMCNECPQEQSGSVVQITCDTTETKKSTKTDSILSKVCEKCKCKVCESRECLYLNKKGSGNLYRKPFETNEITSKNECLCKPFCSCANCKFTENQRFSNVCGPCCCKDCKNLRCLIAQQTCDCNFPCPPECSKKGSNSGSISRTPKGCIPPANKLPVNYMQVMCAFTGRNKGKTEMVDKAVDSAPYSCQTKPETVQAPVNKIQERKCEVFCPGKSFSSCVVPMFKENLPSFYHTIIPDTEEELEPERSRSNCNCTPCDCVICEPKKPKKIKKEKSLPKLIHECTCDVCECDICEKNPRVKPCTCDDCDCQICPSKRKPKTQEKDTEFAEDTSGPATCECSPCNCCAACPGTEHNTTDGDQPSKVANPTTEVYIMTTIQRGITELSPSQFTERNTRQQSNEGPIMTESLVSRAEIKRANRYVEHVKCYSETSFTTESSDLYSHLDDNLSNSFSEINLTNQELIENSSKQHILLKPLDGTIDHLLPRESEHILSRNRSNMSNNTRPTEVNNIHSYGDTTSNKVVRKCSSVIDDIAINPVQLTSQASLNQNNENENFKNNVVLPIINSIDEELKFNRQFFRAMYFNREFTDKKKNKVITNYYNALINPCNLIDPCNLIGEINNVQANANFEDDIEKYLSFDHKTELNTADNFKDFKLEKPEGSLPTNVAEHISSTHSTLQYKNSNGLLFTHSKSPQIEKTVPIGDVISWSLFENKEIIQKANCIIKNNERIEDKQEDTKKESTNIKNTNDKKYYETTMEKSQSKKPDPTFNSSTKIQRTNSNNNGNLKENKEDAIFMTNANSILMEINQKRVKDISIKCKMQLTEHIDIKPVTPMSCDKYSQLKNNNVETILPLTDIDDISNESVGDLLKARRRILSLNYNKVNSKTELEESNDTFKDEGDFINSNSKGGEQKKTLLNINLNSLLYTCTENRRDTHFVYKSLTEAKYYSDQLTNLVTRYKNEHKESEQSDCFQKSIVSVSNRISSNVFSDIKDKNVTKINNKTAQTTNKAKVFKSKGINKIGDKTRKTFITDPKLDKGSRIHRKNKNTKSRYRDNYGRNINEDSPSRGSNELKITKTNIKSTKEVKFIEQTMKIIEELNRKSNIVTATETEITEQKTSSCKFNWNELEDEADVSPRDNTHSEINEKPLMQTNCKNLVKTSQSDTSGLMSMLPKLRVHVPDKTVPMSGQTTVTHDEKHFVTDETLKPVNEIQQKESKASSEASRNGMNIGFLALRRISNHSVLVKWNLPKVTDNVLGFELLANGRSVQKIYSPAKCKAVVTCLPTGEKVLFTIQTLTTENKSGYPSSTILYDPKIKYKAMQLVH